jgi:histidinol dehydrogenase
MNKIQYPKKEDWSALLQRPALNLQILEEQVQSIIQEVAANGDRAVKQFTREFDGFDGESLEVTAEEIAASAKEISPGLKKAIEEAYWNIQTFHKKQLHPQVKWS